MKYEQPGFYSKEDLRSENRELALKMFFRELVILNDEKVNDLINKWKMQIEEIGTRSSVAIFFPDGVIRNQWFYDEKGNPYSKKHDGLPEVVKKSINKLVKKKTKK